MPELCPGQARGVQDVTIAFLSVCQANQIKQIRCNLESELTAQAAFLAITDKALPCP